MSGRQQTTKGVWIARSPKLEDPATLVLDLEGSDGRERGEDDTNFERQVVFLFVVGVCVCARVRALDPVAACAAPPVARERGRTDDAPPTPPCRYCSP